MKPLAAILYGAAAAMGYVNWGSALVVGGLITLGTYCLVSAIEAAVGRQEPIDDPLDLGRPIISKLQRARYRRFAERGN